LDWSWTSGVVGGLVVAALIYLARIPRTLDEHDLLVDELEIDLRRWTRDEERGLESEFFRIGNEANTHGALTSGAHVAARGGARARAGHAARDRLSVAMRAYRRVTIAERTPHHLLRWLRCRPLPELEASHDLRVLIERWAADNAADAARAGA
jgi:hypothetical protein